MKKVLYKILLAINTVFAIALLLAYLAVHISPVVFALPALFGLAYPYLLLINIILVITWLSYLRYEALISVVVIALGITHFSNYLKIRKTSGNKENAIKVLSYNTMAFSYLGYSNIETTKQKELKLIKNLNPDIICLQEFSGRGNPSQYESEVISQLGGKYNPHLKVISNGRNRFYGIITLSKYPIVNRGEIEYPQSSSFSIYCDVVIRKDTFRIYNNYLQSFGLRNMDRPFIEEMVGRVDQETIKGIWRLTGSLRRGFIIRAIQSQVLKEHIDRSPYPVIVMGDFNDTPVSYSYRKIRRGLNDSFVNSGYGAGFTYNGNYPPNRIDYILYDDALINTSFDIIKVKYSDHYPIVAYFKKAG